MDATTLSVRATSKTKRVIRRGAVLVSEQGISASDVIKPKRSILDALATHASEYVEFEPPRLKIDLAAVQFA